MIKKIVMTVDFEKAKKKIRSFQVDAVSSIMGDPGEIIRDRISKGKDWRGGQLASLKPSTLNIRKMRGRSSSKPLIDTGNLLKSIKTVKTKKKTGFKMMKYGMHQAKGFVTTNKFAVKNGNKVVGWRDYSDGRFVPPRDFINPEQPFAGMFEVDSESLKKTIRELKKVLRHKKVIYI
jgi:hypothetical protein